MPKISIMIVEDHQLLREGSSYFLSRNENFEIIAQTGDGALAIELAREKRPKIVLLDINLEPLGGLEVLKMIRKLSPASKIIIVSVHSEPAHVKKMLRSGARGYVTKDSSLNELTEAINEVNKGNIFICQKVKDLHSEQAVKASGEVPSINSLSERELEVVRLLNKGESSREIAARLNISLKTVEVHRHHVLKKMNLKNTVSLIQYISSQAIEL